MNNEPTSEEIEEYEAASYEAYREACPELWEADRDLIYRIGC